MKPKRDEAALLATYARTRATRDLIRKGRDACLCERGESGEQVELDADGMPVFHAPCWKSARKREGEDGDKFRLDPPISEWCATCRKREALVGQLRHATRQHAAAKRAILARGRALAREGEGGGK